MSTDDNSDNGYNYIQMQRNFIVFVFAFTGNCKKWFEEKRKQNTRATTSDDKRQKEKQRDTMGPPSQCLSLKETDLENKNKNK